MADLNTSLSTAPALHSYDYINYQITQLNPTERCYAEHIRNFFLYEISPDTSSLLERFSLSKDKKFWWGVPRSIPLSFNFIRNTISLVAMGYPPSAVVDLFDVFTRNLELNQEPVTDYENIDNFLHGLTKLSQMPDNSVELLLFIPPVFIGNGIISSYYIYERKYFFGNWPDILNQIIRVLVPGGRCITCGCHLPWICQKSVLANVYRSEIVFTDANYCLLSIDEKPMITS